MGVSEHLGTEGAGAVRTRRARHTAFALWLALIALPVATASAAGPANDNRADAQTINRIPASVNGTTIDSTKEDEPDSFCGANAGSVWYRVNPQQKGRVIVTLAANGDLDAIVDVYRVQRSQLNQVTCERTNTKGKASLAFRTKADDTYLVRVSQLMGSVSDTFKLDFQLAQPAAQPPGPALPRKGVKGTLDRVLNPSAAYSIRMSEGVTYRFNLASGEACTPLQIYAPGTRSFASASPVKRLSCGGYTLFTPRGGESGLYTLLAKAPSRRGSVRYRLTGGRATIDDTTPGRPIRNYARVHGSLSGGGIDVVDLYRFDVSRRSALRVVVNSQAGFELNLLRDNGHVLRTSRGELRTRIAPGRYYLAVRAAPGTFGKYTLTRLSRMLTRTGLNAGGGRSTTVTPGSTVNLAVHVSPGASGPVRVVIERFDPLEGWQFSRRYFVTTGAGGDSSIAWTPPSVGRYRARASFRGTRGFSPSHSGYAKVRVEAPLSG
jgi:hypothetical protein